MDRLLNVLPVIIEVSDFMMSFGIVREVYERIEKPC